MINTIIDADRDLYQSPEIWKHLGHPGYESKAAHGLPVGYLTSQVFGNHYLNPLDHFIKGELKVPGYIRCMDNLTLFSNRQRDLRDFRGRIVHFLHNKLGLQLRPDRSQLRSCTSTITYLGYEVNRQGHASTAQTLYQMGKKIRRVSESKRKGAEQRLPVILQGYGGWLSF